MLSFKDYYINWISSTVSTICSMNWQIVDFELIQFINLNDFGLQRRTHSTSPLRGADRQLQYSLNYTL